MNFCPKCERKYEKTYSFCPLDGTPLKRSHASTSDSPRNIVLKDKYRILDVLSADNTETVYLAVHEILKRNLIVRLFHNDFISQLRSLEKFKAAVSAASKIFHRNIVVNYDLDQAPDGRYFLASEFVDGVSLEGAIRREGRLNQSQVVYLVRQIAEALREAHRYGVYHGNLKPSDIIITRDLNGSSLVKIANFGVAKFIADHKLQRLEAGGDSTVAIEDVAYLSPEQAGGGRDGALEERDDIYSLGIIMYEMLSGGLPFQANSAQAMLDALVLTDPVAIRNVQPDIDISPRLDALVLKAMARRPQNRFQSVEQLLVMLDGIYEELRLQESVVSPPERNTEGKPPPKTRVEEPLEKTVGTSYKKLFWAVTSLLLIFIVTIVAAIFFVRLRPKYGKLNVRTNPPEAVISIDGRAVGTSPLYQDRMSMGRHWIKAAKAGYVDAVQQIDIGPDRSERIELTLQPQVTGKLGSEQQRQIAEFTHRAENALNEGILAPPPDDYNVLYFCNKILEVDPTNSFALDMKNKVAEKYRTLAEYAYEHGNWIEAERQYRTLGLIFPNDEAIKRRLTEVIGKMNEMQKEKQKKIEELTAKIEVAIQSGNLVPPASDNALDNITMMQRLDNKNAYAKKARDRVKELLRANAEKKITEAKWEEAKTDYQTILKYFPGDKNAQTRLAYITGEAEKVKKAEDLKSQPDQQKSAANSQEAQRQAISAFQAGDYDKAIGLLSEVEKANASNFETYYYLAMAYQKRGRTDAAISNFEKCIHLNPNHAAAHLQLGLLYEAQKATDLAEHHLLRARDLGGAEGYSKERLNNLIEDIKLRTNLTERESKPFAVEHKHIMSSCKGDLFISSSGARFEPQGTDHMFSEKWENLRVTSKSNTFEFRVRGDRKFNIRALNDEDARYIRLLIGKYRK